MSVLANQGVDTIVLTRLCKIAAGVVVEGWAKRRDLTFQNLMDLIFKLEYHDEVS